MTTHAILPVQCWNKGKSRLSTILNADQRRALNIHLFHHVLQVTKAVLPAQTILIVSPSDEVLRRAAALGAHGLQTQAPLNTALHQAVDLCLQHQAEKLLILSIDLPQLTPADLQILLAAPTSCVNPDQQEQGTNALFLNPARNFPFSYGPGSCRKHLANAEHIGLDLQIIKRPSLSKDLDTPEDFNQLRSYLPRAL